MPHVSQRPAHRLGCGIPNVGAHRKASLTELGAVAWLVSAGLWWWAARQLPPSLPPPDLAWMRMRTNRTMRAPGSGPPEQVRGDGGDECGGASVPGARRALTG